MFYKVLLLLLSLILTPLHPTEQCSIEPTPEWVKGVDFPLQPVELKPTQVNLQYLLIETQRNWEEKSVYQHYVIKMLSQAGIEAISQLSIDFDPTYSQVVMHQIRVHRDGEWTDRLEDARHNIVQRESELEKNLYNGDLTAIYFIEDIREGDILEYSYSIVGETPIFGSHLTDLIYFQDTFAVEQMNYRLLAHPDLPFEFKAINTPVEPTITDHAPSLREWEWTAVNPSVYKSENDQPVWHNPPAHLQLSQYKTWADVAQKVAPLYRLPADFPETLPPEMITLVESWKEATPILSEQALLAIRFVQDQVRYLGIEENVGAFTPTDPRITFQRRFGDCKDKTQLLRTLLHLLEIDSTPLLVHSTHGPRLPHVLPMPRLFNHVILQINLDGTPYWIDSTINLQGGSLETNSIPSYHWGMLIDDTTTELTSLPNRTLPHPTEIDTLITFASKEEALMRNSATFYGFEADYWRRTLKERGHKRISDSLLHDLQHHYGAVEIEIPLETSDDRESNILTMTMTYRIPFDEELDLYSYTLHWSLDTHLNPARTAPYKLNYPLWTKEHIRIENPYLEWDAFEETYLRDHPSLHYTQVTRISGRSAEFDIELKHLQDHVPLDSLKSYWKIVKEIKKNDLPPLTINELIE